MARRRPLVFLALAWILGILAGHELTSHPELNPFYLWLVTLGLLALTIILYRLQRRHWPLGLLLTTIGLGVLFYSQARLPVEQLYPLLEKLTTVRGVVINYPTHRPERSSFVIRPQGLPGALQVFYYHPQKEFKEVHYGDELTVEAHFEIPWEFEDFNYREHLLTRNIWGIGTLWSSQQLKDRGAGHGNPVLRWSYELRQHLFGLIDRYVHEPGSALLKGLLFGERAYLSREVEASFRDAGVMHVLAVSGMNLAILIGLFWAILRLFPLSATQIYMALLPLVFIYLLVVGFEVSLLRASLMFGFVTLGWVIAEQGWILRSWIDPLQGLSVAALLILIATPQALFDISFQLSFAATAGILIALQLFRPTMRELGERIRLRWDMSRSLLKRILFKLGEKAVLFGLISLAAQLAVAPILAYHFHRVYLGALLANLLVVPLATIALWLGVFVLLAAVTPLAAVAQGLGRLEYWVLEGLTDLTQFFANLPGAYLMIDRGLQLTMIVVLPLILNLTTLQGFELASFKLKLKGKEAM